MNGYDFVPTIGNRGGRHPHGMVGVLWQINNPDSVYVGDCFLKGRLKKGDLFLCTGHTGDCFQDYMFVKEYGNGLKAFPEWTFGSYGIGDSTKFKLFEGELELLKNGKMAYRNFNQFFEKI